MTHTALSIRDVAARAGYGVIELATGGRGIERTVCGERIRFPVRWFRYYPAVYEPDTFAFLRKHVQPDTLSIDVGAHIGLFTVLLARLVGPRGQVISFEPSESTRSVLLRTVRLNGLHDRASVRGEAVAAVSGTSVFYQSEIPGCNANSLVPAALQTRQTQVSVVSVDSVAEGRSKRVGCIKIDAEGSEIAVVRGARETIASDRPVIALGVHPNAIARAGGTLDELWEELAALNTIVTHHGEELTRRSFLARRDLFDVQILSR